MLLLKEERDFRPLEMMDLCVWKQALLLAPGSADLPWQLVGFTCNNNNKRCWNHDKLFPWQILGQIVNLTGEFNTRRYPEHKKGKEEIPSDCWSPGDYLKTQVKLPEVWTAPTEGSVSVHKSWGTSRTLLEAKTMLECFNLHVPSWVSASVIFRLQD